MLPQKSSNYFNDAGGALFKKDFKPTLIQDCDLQEPDNKNTRLCGFALITCAPCTLNPHLQTLNLVKESACYKYFKGEEG